MSKGRIIVDSSILIRLESGIDSSFFRDEAPAAKSVRRYLDFLSFLGRQGFEIVIPAMVAFQTSDVLMNAPNLSSIYTQNSGGSKQTNRILLKYLDDVKGNKIPGVTLHPSKAKTDYAAYLSELEGVAGNDMMHLPVRRAQLARIQKDNQMNTRAMTETACMDTLAEQLKNPDDNSPVFFLSDTIISLTDCHQRFDAKVGRINMRGFLRAFDESDVFEHLGIRPDHVMHMMGDINPSDNFSIIDTTEPPGVDNNNPFSRALEALTLAMDTEVRETYKRKEKPPEAPKSQVDKFNAKWGRNTAGETRPGSGSGTKRG